MDLRELAIDLQSLTAAPLIEVFDKEAAAIDNMTASSAATYVEITTKRLATTMPAMVELARHIGDVHMEETGDKVSAREREIGCMLLLSTLQAAIDYDELSRQPKG